MDSESSSDTLANEGMRVLLNCRARGNPEPVISWKRQDEKPIKLCTPEEQDKRKQKKKKECKEGERADLEDLSGWQTKSCTFCPVN